MEMELARVRRVSPLCGWQAARDSASYESSHGSDEAQVTFLEGKRCILQEPWRRIDSAGVAIDKLARKAMGSCQKDVKCFTNTGFNLHSSTLESLSSAVAIVTLQLMAQSSVTNGSINCDPPDSPITRRLDDQEDVIHPARKIIKEHPLEESEIEASPGSCDVDVEMTKRVNNDSCSQVAWSNLHSWIHSLCLVTFDIELGQAIELIFPGDTQLSDRDKSNICYLSFPDSNSGCMGDTQYFFRTRCSSVKLPEYHYKYNENCLPSLESNASYLYGFVYFRQIKDRAARRGYLQKSLVLLTHLPLLSFFKSLVSLIANEFFDSGSAVISVAAKEIDTCWPLPTPGSFLSLNLMGSVVQVKIPHKDDTTSANATINLLINSSKGDSNDKLDASSTRSPSRSLSHSTSSPALHIQESTNNSCLSPVLTSSPCIVISSAHEVNLFKALFPVMTHMQSLWELVLTCEPLLVMASSPDVTCEVVAALVSSIWPLKCSSDYRPFFTIHDSEFKEFTSTTTTPPPCILGVTNPFFAKSLQHWPHIVRVGEYGWKSPEKSSPLRLLTSIETSPVNSKFKPFLNRDRSILKKLVKGIESQRPSEVQSALIRRFFLQLTQSFLIPLERYIATLMPLKKNVSPFKSTPSIQPFNQDEFFKLLQVSGPSSTCGIKGDWEGLYRKFFRTANFATWYEARLEQVNNQLNQLHINIILESDLLTWIKCRSEVEAVDLVLTLKDKIKQCSHEADKNDEIITKLSHLVKQMVTVLPPDLHSILAPR